MVLMGALQVAGQQSGVAVVDKAQSAVNTVKIINALNEISDILKACTISHHCDIISTMTVNAMQTQRQCHCQRQCTTPTPETDLCKLYEGSVMSQHQHLR